MKKDQITMGLKSIFYLYLFLLIAFLGIIIAMFISAIFDEDMRESHLIFGAIFLMLPTAAFIYWTKKGFFNLIEFNSEGMILKKLWKKDFIDWDKVTDIQLHKSFIGIVWYNLPPINGFPYYEVNIEDSGYIRKVYFSLDIKAEEYINKYYKTYKESRDTY